MLPSEEDDDRSILIELSSSKLQFFSELFTTKFSEFHMVSPQTKLQILI